MENIIVILPLRTIGLQILFLWVAIAIESYILHTQLDLHRRFSVFYAATLNLLANLMGWFIFFNLEVIVPDNISQRLVDLVLFSSGDVLSLAGFILGVVGAFLVSWFIKQKGLIVLRNIRQFLINKNYEEGGFTKAASQSFIEQTIGRSMFNAHLFSSTTILIMSIVQFIILNLERS